jgi:hypothetical protein
MFYVYSINMNSEFPKNIVVKKHKEKKEYGVFITRTIKAGSYLYHGSSVLGEEGDDELILERGNWFAESFGVAKKYAQKDLDPVLRRGITGRVFQFKVKKDITELIAMDSCKSLDSIQTMVKILLGNKGLAKKIKKSFQCKTTKTADRPLRNANAFIPNNKEITKALHDLGFSG